MEWNGNPNIHSSVLYNKLDNSSMQQNNWRLTDDNQGCKIKWEGKELDVQITSIIILYI